MKKYRVQYHDGYKAWRVQEKGWFFWHSLGRYYPALEVFEEAHFRSRDAAEAYMAERQQHDAERDAIKSGSWH